jgi:pilus assembly protein CpaF
MVQMGHMGLPSGAIRTQIVGAVDLIIQVARQRDGGRRLTQVTEICGMEGDVIAINDIFSLELLPGQDRDGRLIGKYNRSRMAPSFTPRLAYFGLDKAWQEVMAE